MKELLIEIMNPLPMMSFRKPACGIAAEDLVFVFAVSPWLPGIARSNLPARSPRPGT